MYDVPKYRKATYDIRKGLTDAFINDITIFDYLSEAKNMEPWESEICYLMPRLLFSAVESNPDELTGAQVEQYGFDVTKFNTLRYFKHADKGGWFDNHFGKAMVDLSRITNDQITTKMRNIHIPFPSECKFPFRHYETGIFRVHHYLGSWEAYSAKGDIRRNRERFDMFAYVNEGSDYQLQSWLRKFVEKVGVKKSQKLLQYSGLLEKGKSRLIDTEDYVVVEQNGESKYYYGMPEAN